MNNNVTVGILSDSHGYLDPRVRDVVNQCDYIIHAGDIFNADVLAQLQPKEQMIAVAGNNDLPHLWDENEVGVVSDLPETCSLELPDGLVVVEHGHRLGNHPDHGQLREAYAEARLIVYGHTHHRVIDQDDAPWVVNPGASGRVRTHGGPSCLVLNAGNDDWSFETVVFAETEVA